MVPPIRIRDLNGRPVRPDGEYVLYWMVAFRRLGWNFALDRAVERARSLGKPLLIFEPLSCAYRWASDRFHRFVIDGMEEHARRSVAYYPYLETAPGAGKGLLAELGRRACAIVTDDHPGFWFPRVVAAGASRADVLVEAVDSNGLLPLRATEKVFSTAFSFRRYLQRELPIHLEEFPLADPLKGLHPGRLPEAILRKWPAAAFPVDLSSFPIDHGVGPAGTAGGTEAARKALDLFVEKRLARYDEDRNRLEKEATSGLSPWLHFGHLSAHEIHSRVSGRRGAEPFLDQLVTWRELGFNMTSHRPASDQYESLPAWSRQTLAKHAKDRRAHVYGPAEFEGAATHDPLWNAAQRQLVREGRIHTYLRMLWGKKILEWSRRPEEALETMFHLNDKFALDGRDPNSISGICWILGRYDRPWGPERPIFGTVRYMSSENTARKMRVKDYVARYGPVSRV